MNMQFEKRSSSNRDDAVKNFQKCTNIDSSEKNYDSFNSLTDLYFTYDNNFQKKLKQCIKNTTEISFLKGKLDRWYNKKQQQVKVVEKDIFSKIIKQFEKKTEFFYFIYWSYSYL